jgi:hypothetical protein
MPQLITDTYGSLMYELKKPGKVFTSKFVGTGPSSYNKRIYQAVVSQRLRNTALHHENMRKNGGIDPCILNLGTRWK